MTTETMTSSNEWMQYYQHSLSGEAAAQTGPGNFIYGGQVSDSTVVTTTITSTSVPSPRGSGSSDHQNPSPDGRVSRPIRRRSRASRRTPTTLLKTDTSNFRAMVQQFTGGPNQTLAAAGFQHFRSGSNFSFEQGNHHVQQVMNPSSSVAPNPYPLQLQQQQQLRTNDQQLYPQPYMFSSLTNFDHAPAANAFHQRLDGSRTTRNDHTDDNNNNML